MDMGQSILEGITFVELAPVEIHRALSHAAGLRLAKRPFVVSQRDLNTKDQPHSVHDGDSHFV